jgi:hypothetical protein
MCSQEDDMRNVIIKFGFAKAAFVAASLSAALYPVSSLAGQHNYGFKIVGHPTDSTVTVKLVNTDTNGPAASTGLFVLQWAATGNKNAPRRLARVPLKPGADGSYVAQARPGDRLQLTAVIAGSGDPVTGSVFVGS